MKWWLRLIGVEEKIDELALENTGLRMLAVALESRLAELSHDLEKLRREVAADRARINTVEQSQHFHPQITGNTIYFPGIHYSTGATTAVWR